MEGLAVALRGAFDQHGRARVLRVGVAARRSHELAVGEARAAVDDGVEIRVANREAERALAGGKRETELLRRRHLLEIEEAGVVGIRVVAAASVAVVFAELDLPQIDE